MSEWISVKDRLPDEEIEVLACAVDLFYILHRWQGRWYDAEMAGIEPTHWMPLPKLPRESE